MQDPAFFSSARKILKMNGTDGQIIFQVFHTVERIGKEIDSLLTLMENEIASTFPKSQNRNQPKIVTKWNTIHRESENQWTYTDAGGYIGIGKTHDKPKRHINFQISLNGDGMCGELCHNQVPLLHVALWGDRLDFDEDFYFSLANIHNDNNPTLVDGVLFSWEDNASDWSDQEWAYSLKLTSVNNIEDVKHKIIKPFFSFLEKGVDTAILKKIEGIIHYEMKEGRYCIKQV